MAFEQRRGRPEIVKAKRAMARLIYRQFHNAGAGKEEVLRFINELMSLVARDAGPHLKSERGIIDSETGFVAECVAKEMLEFEIRNTLAASPMRPCFCAVITVSLPDHAPQSDRAAVHALLVECVRTGLRTLDIAGRLDRDRYVVMLPGALREDGNTVVERLQHKLRESLTSTTRGLEVELHATQLAPDMRDSAAVVEACLQTEPRRLFPFRASSTVTKLPVPKRTTRVKLALGGGAARAAAHIGAIAALRQRGVRIEGISGTSAGAIVGAMFAMGYSTERMLETFRTLPQSAAYRAIRRAFAAYRRRHGRVSSADRYFRNSSLAVLADQHLSIADQGLFEALIEHFVGRDRDLSSLAVPFGACATDLAEGRAVPLLCGSLHMALLASCAAPGLFPPQSVADQVFVDGSQLSEVPVVAARRLGVRAPLVGVHLARPRARVHAFGSSAELAVRSAALVHAELTREQLRSADLALSLCVRDMGWLDFSRSDEIATRAQVETLRWIDEIHDQLEAREAPPSQAVTLG